MLNNHYMDLELCDIGVILRKMLSSVMHTESKQVNEDNVGNKVCPKELCSEKPDTLCDI